MAGEKLATWFTKAETNESKQADLVFGEVIGTAPLRIRVDTNSKIILERHNIVLSSLVRDTPHGEILKLRDRVIMLRANGGQRYFVMDKEDW